jgi:DNA-binding NarL/FixJ family response regulator
MEIWKMDSKNTLGREQMAKIMIVDDHPIVREGLVQLISQRCRDEFTVVGQADNADDALDALTKLRPDVVIVDVFLKGSDGIELVKRIKAMDSDMNVLVLSMHDESLYAERAISAGATGYVMKNEKSDDIIKAIRKVLNGQVYLSDNMMTTLVRGKRTSVVKKGDSLVSSLTDRELEVFRLFGMGWTTRRIAKELHLSIKTIETYCARIKDKLELSNSNELIRHAVHWVNSRDFS